MLSVKRPKPITYKGNNTSNAVKITPAVSYPQYIPVNLDFDEFLKVHPPFFKYYRDNFIFILNLITEIPAYNKDIITSKGFTPINGQKLQACVREYIMYRSYLVNHDIIDTDNQYIAGKKSIGYRFCDQYQTDLKEVHITKTSLVRRLRNSQVSRMKEVRHPHLKKWLNEHLQFDYAGALQYLSEQLRSSLPKREKNAILKYNQQWLNAIKLNDGDYYFKVDSTAGRLHTNFTNLSKGLRKFISYGGQHLVAVDYVNSQPCFIAGLLLKEFGQKSNFESDRPLKRGVFSKEWTKPRVNIKVRDSITVNTTIMLVKSPETTDTTDVSTFIREAQNGTIYEYIQKAIERDEGKPFEGTRQYLKEIIFLSLYSDNRFIWQPEAQPKRTFRGIFPSVYKYLCELKKGDPASLPIFLQKQESELVLNHVTKRISIEYPDMPMFTIHDCLACPAEYKHYVAGVMKEEMYKYIEITPQVKFEYWSVT